MPRKPTSDIVMPLPEYIVSKFHTKYIRGTDDECWLWNAGTTRGYGVFYVHSVHIYAHRLAWQIAHNMTVPCDQKVLHECDNPSCVNPRHLFLGTQQLNVLDMVHKGRYGIPNSGKIYCPQGHVYDDANTYTDPSGYRHCRICQYHTNRRSIERRSHGQ